MKHLYTLILFATCSLTFAQSDLYVSTGSYVYVDGTAFTSGTNASLYVTNDVNLNTDGHIYLRNDAQLLQGNNVGNAGAGQLSVYQTGDANTVMYNYWASPVGINSGAAGNSVFTPNINFYDHIGHANAALNPITSNLATYTTLYDGTATVALTTPQIISSYWLYSFTGTTAPPNEYQDWVGLGGGSIPVGGLQNGTLNPGYGFTMKGNPSAAQKYDFRGRPNNGTITTTINNNRETLIGNPYPSALDSYEFIHNTTSNNQAVITGVLKFWQQDPSSTSHVLSNYVGGYAHYTNYLDDNGTPANPSDDFVADSFTPATFYKYLLNGTISAGPAPGNTTTKTVYRYIPVGQGFMVEGIATGSVTFSNSHRAFYKQSGANSEFFRSSSSASRDSQFTDEGYQILPTPFKRFRINTSFENNGTESYTRQLLMNFHPNATDGFDYGLEAQISEQLKSDANWTLDGVPYVIQAFDYDMELKMPLIVHVENQQLVRFSIYDVQNFDTEQPIYFHDIENDLYINLQDQAYEITLEPGNYTDRFEIVFKSESLSTEEFTDTDFLVMQNNTISQLTILNPNQQEVKSVTLFDVSGKRIFNELNLSVQDRYEFSTKNLSEGVYIAKVTFANQTSMSKKIVVSHKK